MCWNSIEISRWRVDLSCCSSFVMTGILHVSPRCTIKVWMHFERERLHKGCQVVSLTWLLCWVSPHYLRTSRRWVRFDVMSLCFCYWLNRFVKKQKSWAREFVSAYFTEVCPFLGGADRVLTYQDEQVSACSSWSFLFIYFWGVSELCLYFQVDLNCPLQSLGVTFAVCYLLTKTYRLAVSCKNSFAVLPFLLLGKLLCSR